ncbi:MAG: DUF1634 domain-containing protein [Elusimicrobia bacterium]|nr:DUF1634 domain-containing protein [Elusimicrobiota bacterium]
MKKIASAPAAEGQAVPDNVYADVYKVLMGGMFISTALFAVGLVLALLHPVFVPLDPAWISSHYHWRLVADGLRRGDPAAYMLSATFLLILTPVLRVLVSIYAFLVDRDYKYAAITSIVFGVILLTVVLSRFGLR